MTWRVDPPIRVGEAICAAVSEVKVSLHGAPQSVSGTARKDVLCVVVVRDGVATGHAPNGDVMDAEALERRFPGAVADILSQTGDPS